MKNVKTIIGSSWLIMSFMISLGYTSCELEDLVLNIDLVKRQIYLIIFVMIFLIISE